MESKIWHKGTYLQKRLTNTENRRAFTKWEELKWGMEWEVGISRDKQLYID